MSEKQILAKDPKLKVAGQNTAQGNDRKETAASVSVL
jgi:hypothetical protein